MTITAVKKRRKGYLVQGRDTGTLFKDIYEFPKKREAKAYIRRLVKDWAENPTEFRIITVKRAKR